MNSPETSLPFFSVAFSLQIRSKSLKSFLEVKTRSNSCLRSSITAQLFMRAAIISTEHISSCPTDGRSGTAYAQCLWPFQLHHEPLRLRYTVVRLSRARPGLWSRAVEIASRATSSPALAQVYRTAILHYLFYSCPYCRLVVGSLKLVNPVICLLV